MPCPGKALHERERHPPPCSNFLTDTSKPQYERSFKRWCISKNVRKDEWDFILDRVDKRNRPTDVKVRGVVIPQARLERQRHRKHETVFDLCKSSR